MQLVMPASLHNMPLEATDADRQPMETGSGEALDTGSRRTWPEEGCSLVGSRIVCIVAGTVLDDVLEGAVVVVVVVVEAVVAAGHGHKDSPPLCFCLELARGRSRSCLVVSTMCWCGCG